MSKLKLIVLFLTLNTAVVFANEKKESETPVLMDFNFSSEVDYDKESQVFYDEKSEVFVHLFSMKNSKDILVSYQNESNKLVPVAFLVSGVDNVVIKDVNNRKIVLEYNIDNKGKPYDIEYLANNDSKEGLALTSAGCLGLGSTIDCYRAAMSACNADLSCHVTCIAAGAACPAAVLAACAISCNT